MLTTSLVTSWRVKADNEKQPVNVPPIVPGAVPYQHHCSLGYPSFSLSYLYCQWQKYKENTCRAGAIHISIWSQPPCLQMDCSDWLCVLPVTRREGCVRVVKPNRWHAHNMAEFQNKARLSTSFLFLMKWLFVVNEKKMLYNRGIKLILYFRLCTDTCAQIIWYRNFSLCATLFSNMHFWQHICCYFFL